MVHGYDTMMKPSIEELLDKTGSKFELVTLAAKRSRAITEYLGQLGQGIGTSVPPQVTSTSSKPLSIALEEISVDKIIPARLVADAVTEGLSVAEPDGDDAA